MENHMSHLQGKGASRTVDQIFPPHQVKVKTEWVRYFCIGEIVHIKNVHLPWRSQAPYVKSQMVSCVSILFDVVGEFPLLSHFQYLCNYAFFTIIFLSRPNRVHILSAPKFFLSIRHRFHPKSLESIISNTIARVSFASLQSDESALLFIHY